MIIKKRASALAALIILFMLLVIPGKIFALPVNTVPATFASNNSGCVNTFFGLEPWYYYLPQGEIYDGKSKLPNGQTYERCDIRCFNLFNEPANNQCGNKKSDLPFVAIAIIDDLLRIAGILALGFIIYGAFKYVGSQGSPDATDQAQSTIVNALIGLLLASVAVVLVNFLGNNIK